MNEGSAFVTLTIDGVRCAVPAHTSVAAALLNRDHSEGVTIGWRVRRSAGGMPRGPLCGMGICFECRATVNGLPHERTCQLVVCNDMEIRTDG